MKSLSLSLYKSSSHWPRNLFILSFSPTVFIKFLEYLLRHNPALNYEIKNSMYFVMNSINDDFAKNTISGLLDFIFNS